MHPSHVFMQVFLQQEKLRPSALGHKRSFISLPTERLLSGVKRSLASRNREVFQRPIFSTGLGTRLLPIPDGFSCCIVYRAGDQGVTAELDLVTRAVGHRHISSRTVVRIDSGH